VGIIRGFYMEGIIQGYRLQRKYITACVSVSHGGLHLGGGYHMKRANIIWSRKFIFRERVSSVVSSELSSKNII
jgi:hypothetical protein